MRLKQFAFGVACSSGDDYILSSLLKQKFYDETPRIWTETNNKQSLCEVYNKFIDRSILHNIDWLILTHDDVYINTNNVCERILKLNYDVIGVAGTVQAQLQSPALWHIMGGGFEGGNLRGAVAHGDETNTMMTGFGPYPSRCIMIDGVFMAISRNVFENVRFDESCPSKFHFYDLSYSLECHQRKYKVGVGDIPIIHKSPGLREFTQEWKEGEEWFLTKYNQS